MDPRFAPTAGLPFAESWPQAGADFSPMRHSWIAIRTSCQYLLLLRSAHPAVFQSGKNVLHSGRKLSIELSPVLASFAAKLLKLLGTSASQTAYEGSSSTWRDAGAAPGLNPFTRSNFDSGETLPVKRIDGFVPGRRWRCAGLKIQPPSPTTLTGDKHRQPDLRSPRLHDLQRPAAVRERPVRFSEYTPNIKGRNHRWGLGTNRLPVPQPSDSIRSPKGQAAAALFDFARMNDKRSALIVSACVVGMPCGKPL